MFWKRDSFLEPQDGNGGRLDFLYYPAGLFVTELGGRCVFFEGVQKYFVKMEKTWSNLKKARDARADPAVRAKRNVQKKNEKIAKNGKKRIFWTKKSPPKSVKCHLGGTFFNTPCRMFSFRDLLLTSIFFNGGRRRTFALYFLKWRLFAVFSFCYVFLYLEFFATFSITCVFFYSKYSFKNTPWCALRGQI